MEDIKFITLKSLDMPWGWSESKDHAKWGISIENNWVCVGDINRMISQKKRGGGTIAFQDAALWALLKKTEELQVPDDMTKAQAVAHIQKTHAKPAAAAPAAPPAAPAG